MTLALAGLALLAWLYLGLGHSRFWQAGPMLPAAAALPAEPAVDIVVPARDEAESIAATVRSLLAQEYGGAIRLLVVDDGSTDETGALALAAGRGDGRLRVIAGAARPPGWSGKLWAVEQGVRHTGGDTGAGSGTDPGADTVAEPGAEPGTDTGAALILLTDADIVHDAQHLRALVAAAERGRLDLVSEMVALRAESLAERALVPAFVFFFQMLYPFAAVNDPKRRAAAAAGGTMLIRRAALARIGGIGSLRGALIDDVTLAKRVKRGGPIFLGHSRFARSLRPYPSAADVWRMVARTAYVQLRFSPPLLLGTVAGLALIWLLPPGVALFGGGAARVMAAAAWACSALCYLPTLRRFGQSPLWALLLPAIACFYMAATIGSAIDHHRGRGVVWKRRAYRDASA